MESTSYTLLSHLDSSNVYKIRIAEEKNEIAFTNKVELWAIDHEKGRIYPDPEGNILVFSDLMEPSSCTDDYNTNCVSEISREDGIYWQSDSSVGRNYLEIEFPRFGDNGKLLFKLKHENFLTGKLYKANENISINTIRNWIDDYDSIALYVWNGIDWNFVRYINAGIDADSYVAIQIDLTHIVEPSVKIKLEMRSGSYKIDFVGVDYSEKNYQKQVVNLKEAILDGKDVTQKVKYDDNSYAVIKKGQQIDLLFRELTRTNLQRSYILVAKGYYYIL